MSTIYDVLSVKGKKRYNELIALRDEGKISDLRFQKIFLLIPEQKDENGHCIEWEITYIADFVYSDTATGKTVAEDLGEHKRRGFTIRKKLMLYVHGIQVKEI